MDLLWSRDLSQPNLLKPLTVWGAEAFAGLGGLPLFLLGPLGTWVGGTGVISCALGYVLVRYIVSSGLWG